MTHPATVDRALNALGALRKDATGNYAEVLDIITAEVQRTKDPHLVFTRVLYLMETSGRRA